MGNKNKIKHIYKTTKIKGPVNKSIYESVKQRTSWRKKYMKNKFHIITDKKIIIFNSPFNIWHHPPFSNKCLTKNWIEYRLMIFIKYTLRSLTNQTNQNFFAIIKYDDSSEKIINELVKSYKKLPANINFIKKSNYNEFIKEKIKGYDYVYITRLDSDDMYHKTFVEQLYNIKLNKHTKAIINQNGYIFDSNNKILAKFPRKSPNYYTLIYKANDYINGKRYTIKGGHPNVIKLPHQIINKPNYIRHAHSKNNETNIYKYNIKKSNYIVNKNRIRNILKEFIGCDVYNI